VAFSQRCRRAEQGQPAGAGAPSYQSVEIAFHRRLEKSRKLAVAGYRRPSKLPSVTSIGVCEVSITRVVWAAIRSSPLLRSGTSVVCRCAGWISRPAHGDEIFQP